MTAFILGMRPPTMNRSTNAIVRFPQVPRATIAQCYTSFVAKTSQIEPKSALLPGSPAEQVADADSPRILTVRRIVIAALAALLMPAGRAAAAVPYSALYSSESANDVVLESGET